MTPPGRIEMINITKIITNSNSPIKSSISSPSVTLGLQIVIVHLFPYLPAYLYIYMYLLHCLLLLSLPPWTLSYCKLLLWLSYLSRVYCFHCLLCLCYHLISSPAHHTYVFLLSLPTLSHCLFVFLILLVPHLGLLPIPLFIISPLSFYLHIFPNLTFFIPSTYLIVPITTLAQPLYFLPTPTYLIYTPFPAILSLVHLCYFIIVSALLLASTNNKWK